MAFDRMGEMLVRMEDAQLRVYNIKDPVQPESGWLVPPDPDKECRAAPKGSGDADRGRAGGYPRYVYVTNRNWGVWILRQRGPDQPAPTDW